MTQITEIIKKEVKETVYNFFAEECEVDLASLNDDTNIIKDIDGDSLMFLELIEIERRGERQGQAERRVDQINQLRQREARFTGQGQSSEAMMGILAFEQRQRGGDQQ